MGMTKSITWVTAKNELTPRQSLVRIFESGDIYLLPVVESKSYTEKDT